MQAGRMNETMLAGFAAERKYEETVVALAALSKVPIKIADRLMAGERPDPVLILCRAAGMSWPTVKSIIVSCSQGNGTSVHGSVQGSVQGSVHGSVNGLDAALANYERLSPSTAQRVVRFWQVKQNA